MLGSSFETTPSGVKALAFGNCPGRWIYSERISHQTGCLWFCCLLGTSRGPWCGPCWTQPCLADLLLLLIFIFLSRRTKGFASGSTQCCGVLNGDAILGRLCSVVGLCNCSGPAAAHGERCLQVIPLLKRMKAWYLLSCSESLVSRLYHWNPLSLNKSRTNNFELEYIYIFIISVVKHN